MGEAVRAIAARRRGVGRVLTAWLAWGAIAGCGSGPNDVPGARAEPARKFPGVTLVVGALGDPKILVGLGAQRGEWMASRGGAIETRPEAVAPKALEGVDVVLFRGDRLGDLIDVDALATIPESAVRPAIQVDPDESDPSVRAAAESAAKASDTFRFDDILSAYRDQVCKYGEDRIGLPYGGTALVLAYRRVAFDDPSNRAAAKKAGLTLEPPDTWEKFDALAKFFEGRDWDGDGAVDHGVALALGADPEGVGDDVFLARALAMGLHPDQFSFLFDADTMSPRVALPPFVESLTKTVALKASGPPGIERFDAEAARKAFRTGKVAMLIDRAELATKWSGGTGKTAAITTAPLPGSDRVFDPGRKAWETPRRTNRPAWLPRGGGWIAAVTKTATGTKLEAAIDFVKYLASADVANRVRSEPSFPMLPVRASLMGSGLPDTRAALGVETRSWSESIAKTFGSERVAVGLRIPRAEAYMAELSRARGRAAGGEPALKVLEEVARSWSARVESLGLDRQKWHYRRSLNTLYTDRVPPSARP